MAWLLTHRQQANMVRIGSCSALLDCLYWNAHPGAQVWASSGMLCQLRLRAGWQPGACDMTLT